MADWTAKDEIIGRLIDRLAPGGSIPLCAVFPAERPEEPIVLLGTVTQNQVIEAMRRAASPASGLASQE